MVKQKETNETNDRKAVIIAVNNKEVLMAAVANKDELKTVAFTQNI